MAGWTVVAFVVTIAAWSAGNWFASEGIQFPDRIRTAAIIAFGLAWFRIGATFVIRGLRLSRGEDLEPRLGIGALEATVWSVTALVYFTLQTTFEPSLGHLALRTLSFFWMLGVLARSRLADESRLRELLIASGPRAVLFVAEEEPHGNG